MTKPRLVFMGTPEFAVTSLERLVSSGYNVVGVVTAPDRPAGRGMQLQQSEVKKFALANGLTILQPPKLKDPDFIARLESLKAELQVVVAFRMLPEIVWNMPPLGTLNVHASLLPQYRGAAPINWAIINGEEKTGVTTFKLQHQIDTGNILLQREVAIGKEETAGDLHDKLKKTGADLLVETLDQLVNQSLREKKQEEVLGTLGRPIKHAPKIHTETCEIDWKQKAHDIYNLIRGLSPHPAAFTFLNGKKLKVFKAHVTKENVSVAPGDFDTDERSCLQFACSDKFLWLDEVQLEGKKKMKIEDFLRGWRR